MSLQPTLEEQDLLADTYGRVRLRMPPRERVAEILLAVGFVAAAAAIWGLDPPRGFPVAPALLCALVMVLASRVQFDTPFGFTVATQLGFVPLLFAVPVAVVSPVVVAVLMVARLPDVFRGKRPPSRLLKEVGNAWFAIGPAAVFAVAAVAPAEAGPALLLLALGAQFAVDFAASTLRYWLERGASFSSQLRETWVYMVDAALSGVGLLAAQDISHRPLDVLLLLPLLVLLWTFARERRYRMEGLLELNAAYRGASLALGCLVEADHRYTGEHSRSVVTLACSVGASLGLDAQRTRNLEFAARLHDIGKVAIPKEIIDKPGPLDPYEFGIVETHTVEGQRILDRIGGFMRDVALIVRSHHERWDGSGYPDGIAGQAIPLEARIIACCDAWNAMRTDRAYRKALSSEVARAELLACAGRQFDPTVVAAFLDIVEMRADRTVGALA